MPVTTSDPPVAVSSLCHLPWRKTQVTNCQKIREEEKGTLCIQLMLSDEGSRCIVDITTTNNDEGKEKNQVIS